MQSSFLCFLTVTVIMTSTVTARSDDTVAAELTIENIMRGAEWVGTSPSRVRWSEDGSEIYFQWNPEGEEESSLYAVSHGGGEPRRLSDEERRRLPASRGEYDEKHRRKLYEKDGDLFLLDIRRDEIRQLTNTIERESDPDFVTNDQISFIRDNNLYLLDLTDGSFGQATNFTQGSSRGDQSTKKTRQEDWLQEQQLQLFEVIRKQQDRREKNRAARREDEPSRPCAVPLGDKKVSQIRLNPEARFVTFRIDDPPVETARASVPHYVTKTGFTRSDEGRTKVGAPRAHSRLGIYDTERDTVYYVATEDIPGITDQPDYLSEYRSDDVNDSTSTADEATETAEARPVIIRGPYWTEDGSRAVVDVRSLDNKDRWLMLLEPLTGELSPLDRQHDEAWIGGPGIGHYASLGWLDDRHFWFQSESTGYSHLYVVDVTTGARRQLTDGQFEVRDVTLSRDRKRFYFVSNAAHPGERHFYRMPSEGGRPVRVTDLPGSVRVYLSPDEKKLALLHSNSYQPWELWVMDNRPGADALQITHSTTAEYDAYPWRDPEIMTFTARDSATVYARLYHPQTDTKNGAAVLFVHGAGYTQNVCRRWTWYFREMMFHNYLADRGYTVMDIDYRGSAGYGRDCRTGIYRHMGGKDLAGC